jgi:CheY-like chemotaxis protein
MSEPAYQLLVIDDSTRDILLLERCLEQAEDATFTITPMSSAQDGLVALGTTAYDLVLLDYLARYGRPRVSCRDAAAWADDARYYVDGV